MATDPDTQLMLSFKAGDQRVVAEVLAQEAFLRVYKAALRYRPKARFSTWLFKIATNVCLNEMRRPAHRQQALRKKYRNWHRLPTERIQQIRDRLSKCQHLTPAQKEALRMPYQRWQNLTPEQRERVKELLRRRGLYYNYRLTFICSQCLCLSLFSLKG